jgi:UDP-glucose:glycoprotein glucosyltransferase
LEKLLSSGKVADTDAQKVYVHDFDHVYPADAATPLASSAPAVVHYGVVGSDKFRAFHALLSEKSKAGEIQYVLRHCPPVTGTKMPLQGWGAALDIKNMEYKTLDDSMKSDGEQEDGDKEEEEDVVEGFVFSKLAEWKSTDPDYKEHLAQFKTALIEDRAKTDNIKVWDMKDLGLSAVEYIISADDPLSQLQEVSQNFPRYAKALTKVKPSKDLREQIALQRKERVLQQAGRIYVNGLPVDVTSTTFNIFSFVKTIRHELNQLEKLLGLKLPPRALRQLMSSGSGKGEASAEEGTKEGAEEAEEEDPGLLRIDVKKGSADAVTFINNIEKDPEYAQLPTDLSALLQPAYGLPQVKKNLFNLVLVLDPTTEEGQSMMQMVSMIRMQQLPLRIGFVLTSKAMVTASRNGETITEATDPAPAASAKKTGGGGGAMGDAVVEGGSGPVATAWHYAKLFAHVKTVAKAQKDNSLLASFLDALSNAGGGGQNAMLMMMMMQQGGGAMPDAGPKTVANLVTAFGEVEGLGGEDMAKVVLGIEEVSPEADEGSKNAAAKSDSAVSSAANFVVKKGLPLPCFTLNGLLVPGSNVQRGLQQLLGAELQNLQKMLLAGKLDKKTNVYSMLLSGPNVYKRYASFLAESSDGAQQSSMVEEGGAASSHRDLALLLQKDSSEKGFHFLHAETAGSKAEVKRVSFILAADLRTSDGLQLAAESIKFLQSNNSAHVRLALVHNPPQVEDETKAEPLVEGVNAVVGAAMALAIHQGAGLTAGADHTVDQAEGLLAFLLDTAVEGKAVVDAPFAEELPAELVKEQTKKFLKAVRESAKKHLGDNAKKVNPSIKALGAAKGEKAAKALADANKLVSPSAVLLQGAIGVAAGKCAVSANGKALDLIDGGNYGAKGCGFTGEDFVLLEQFERKKRADKVAAVIQSVESISDDSPITRSDLIVRSSLIAAEHAEQSRLSLDVATMDRLMAMTKTTYSASKAGGDDAAGEGGTATAATVNEMLQIVAVLDPLTTAAQRISPVLQMMRDNLNLPVVLMMVPTQDLAEFPLTSFYSFVLDYDLASNIGKESGFEGASFKKLPKSLLLTLKVETPEPWNVMATHWPADPDNLQDADGQLVTFNYRLRSLLLGGQCDDMTDRSSPPPNGLELQLTSLRAAAEGEEGSQLVQESTLVMQNLGYFQMKCDPGVWSLNIAPGRGTKIFEIVQPAGMGADGSVALVATPIRNVVIRDFSGTMESLNVRKREGMEKRTLLLKTAAAAGEGGEGGAAGEEEEEEEEEGDDTDDQSGIFQAMSSMFGGQEGAIKKAVSPKHQGDKIHVFSLATGKLYERMLRIMMTSVTKR